MMKKFIFGVLAMLPLTCLAGVSPTIVLNTPNCAAITQDNLIGCFQNQTDNYLTDYQMKQTLIFENGSSEESIAALGAMQPSFFSVMAISSSVMQKEKIASIWFSIIKGDAANYQVIPGCSTEFTPTAISKSLLAIYKVNGHLYCK